MAGKVEKLATITETLGFPSLFLCRALLVDVGVETTPRKPRPLSYDELLELYQPTTAQTVARRWIDTTEFEKLRHGEIVSQGQHAYLLNTGEKPRRHTISSLLDGSWGFEIISEEHNATPGGQGIRRIIEYIEKWSRKNDDNLIDFFA